MKTKWYTRIIFVILVIVIIFVGCVPGDGTHTIENQAGFFWGIWHGWVAPISLIIEIFDKNIRIYEKLNTGFMYDLGFYIAIISGFGGVSLFRKRNKKEK